MAKTLIANRDDDQLFCTGSLLTEDGDRIWFGHIETADGGIIKVDDIDVLIGHGYWVELPVL